MRNNLVKGFRIVELLVVIVVISILASITVVSFNGIQNRAYVTKASSTVDTIIKTAELYKVVYGSYPTTDNSAVCVGTAANYPAANGFTAGACASESSITVNPAFNALLAEFISTIPDGSLPAVEIEGSSGRGVIYVSDGNYIELFYTIKGDINCPKGNKNLNENGTSSCDLTIGNMPK